MLMEFFAGNFKTGVIRSHAVLFKSQREADARKESILDTLLSAVGWEHGIWAAYADGKPHEEHARNFSQFINHHMVTATA